ncbi:hypothetical protein [Sphingomonas sp.]|jgi:hypothetical protein|uniref:hypothetical protein n=1 Tax=Sphingomonas sp. TaxID=28214 RepID=UPI002EDA6C60
MTVEQRDAADALAAVARTRRRSIELSGYAHAGNIVLAWGLVWLICNLAVHFVPRGGANSWAVGIAAATLYSILHGSSHRGKGPRLGWRVTATVATGFVFMVLLALIAGLDDPRQTNALISLFIAANYAAMGIWTGLRFTWAGLVIALVVTLAWFFDRGNFYLWMGLAGGGALITSGIWLRRA